MKKSKSYIQVTVSVGGMASTCRLPITLREFHVLDAKIFAERFLEPAYAAVAIKCGAKWSSIPERLKVMGR